MPLDDSDERVRNVRDPGTILQDSWMVPLASSVLRHLVGYHDASVQRRQWVFGLTS